MVFGLSCLESHLQFHSHNAGIWRKAFESGFRRNDERFPSRNAPRLRRAAGEALQCSTDASVEDDVAVATSVGGIPDNGEGGDDDDAIRNGQTIRRRR